MSESGVRLLVRGSGNWTSMVILPHQREVTAMTTVNGTGESRLDLPWMASLTVVGLYTWGEKVTAQN